MPDGKLRARRILFVRGRGHGSVLKTGIIRNFNRQKGYGFIQSPGGPDLFFLPSALPKDLAESGRPLDGMEITFEPFTNEEGKPRAKNIAPRAMYHDDVRGGPPPMMQGAPPMAPLVDAQVIVGTVHTYDPSKAFGFIKAEGVREDVFFQRSELPAELKEKDKKEQVIGQLVEFELKTMKDGKLRARRMISLSRRSGGGMGPRTRGRIRVYHQEKGYGFIQCAFAENVFFMRSTLPKEFNGATEAELLDMEVSFELYSKEQGKPRANNLEVIGQDKRVDSDLPELVGGEILVGEIVAFEPMKGYGFVKTSSCAEDIFFQRSGMPEEIITAQMREEVVGQRVEFEVRIMPDGKLRAQQMVLLPPEEGQEPAGETESTSGELTEDLVQEMCDFIAEHGNGVDFGKFSSRFARVKKAQLQKHFLIVMDKSGRHPRRIELPDGHPLRTEEAEESKQDSFD